MDTTTMFTIIGVAAGVLLVMLIVIYLNMNFTLKTMSIATKELKAKSDSEDPTKLKMMMLEMASQSSSVMNDPEHPLYQQAQAYTNSKNLALQEASSEEK